jgi:hypothetical protein
VCDLETSRMGAPYLYDISRLRVNITVSCITIANLLSSYSQIFHDISNTNVIELPETHFYEHLI